VRPHPHPHRLERDLDGAGAAFEGVVRSGRRPGPATDVPDSATAYGARVITVQSGDCLWSIAQRYLGAGDLYPEIARLNYGRQMTDGEVFS
jgi:nucleoid-associated protein YgaU